MENKRKFLKYFGLPGFIVCICLAIPIYMAWRECAINSLLVEESLKGNRYAIAVLAKYEKPWKLDRRIILGAIEANPYALEVLKIAPESSTQ